jgi:hypothetical protein
MPDPTRDHRKGSRHNHGAGGPDPTPYWVYAIGAVVTALILLVVILHLTGNALGGHMGPAGTH